MENKTSGVRYYFFVGQSRNVWGKVELKNYVINRSVRNKDVEKKR